MNILGMNTEQLKGMIRTVLGWAFAGFVGAWLIKHGIPIPDDNAIAMLAAFAVGAFQVVWSLVSKTQLNTVANAAAIVKITPAEQAKAGIADPISPAPTPPA